MQCPVVETVPVSGGTWGVKKKKQESAQTPDITPKGKWMMNLDAVRQQSELPNYEHREE